MTNVLINPNRFFEERSKEEISLKMPFLIILIIGIISAISAYISNSAIMENLPVPAEAKPFMAITSIVTLITTPLIFLLFWLIYSGAFQGISILFKGEGEFKRTLEFTGYGFMPSIFSSIISLIVTYYYVAPALSNIQFSMDDPALLQESIQQAMMANPAMVASTILGTLFTIWSANIWIFGVKHARGLSTRDALISVAIPVGIMISISMFPLISAM